MVRKIGAFLGLVLLTLAAVIPAQSWTHGTPQLQLAAERFFSQGQNTSGGGGPGNNNYTRGESRHLFYTPNADIVGPRIIVTNWGTADDTGEYCGANTVTQFHTLELTTGQTYQFTWSNATTVDVAPCGTIISDPLMTTPGGSTPVTLTANTQYWMRSGLTVASAGQTFIMTNSNWATGEGGFNSSSASSQVNSTGPMTNPGGGTSNAGGIMPAALVGYPQRNGLPVLLDRFWMLGDSIAWGSITSSDGNGNLGHFRMALYQWGPNGSTPAQFAGFKPADWIASNTYLTGPRKRLFMRYANLGICELAHNDIANGRTLAQIQADLIATWTAMKGAGLKVKQTLITPDTSSTDNWATAANQTPRTGFEVGGIRDQLNAWIKTNPNGLLDGYIDIPSAVEDQANPGKWKTNGTAFAWTPDGTHFTNTARDAAIPVVRAAYPNLNYLLERDLNPASNDNSPVFLRRVG